MASAVDRTIGATMGDLSRRIKRIIRGVEKELGEEMQELEIQKRMAENGRDYHMKQKHELMHENIKMKAQLDKCERMRKQLNAAKALAQKLVKENKSLDKSLTRAENALEMSLAQADDKIDALEAQLGVATEALERVNKTKLRF